MADIAILVAEEYERRVKNSRKAGGAEGDMEINLVSSCVFIMAQRIRNKFRQENMEHVVKWVLEPKSQMGLAASNGVFSA